MPRLPFSPSLLSTSVTSLALGLVMAGCGDDAAGTSAGGTTGGDETGREDTTTRTDTTTGETGDTDADGTSTGEVCECDDGQVCDPATNECVDCYDHEHCDTGAYCDLDTHTCVAGCADADDCEGETPVCNEDDNVCVACTDDEHCEDEDAAHCKADGGTCVACTDDDHCDGDTPACDPDENACVGCLDDTHCDESSPICDVENTTCVECLEDGHCSESELFCDTESTTCVECLEDGHCDEPTPACHDESSICVECTNDDHCGMGYCCSLDANTCSECLPDTVSIMAADTTSGHLILFNPTHGAVKDAQYFELSGGTPFQALQVENEIWVTEQIGDRISRWSLTGEPLGAIGGGNDGELDDLRAITRIGDEIYVANSGSGNGAPGPAIVVFDLDGAKDRHFDISAHVSDPWGLLAHDDDLLVGAFVNAQGVHRFELDGTSVGTFHVSPDLTLAHQISYAHNGDILVASFVTNKVLRLDPTDGSLVSSFDAEDPRGVFQLADGNILWSRGTADPQDPTITVFRVYVYDPDADASTEVHTGSVRHFSILQLP